MGRFSAGAVHGIPGRSLAAVGAEADRRRDTRAGNAQAYFDAWRDVVRGFAKVSGIRENPEPAENEQTYAKLYEMAEQAMRILAGQSEPTLHTLDQYDHQRFGPMLGVSDEGKCAPRPFATRRSAAPVLAVLAERTPITVGVARWMPSVWRGGGSGRRTGASTARFACGAWDGSCRRRMSARA